MDLSQELKGLEELRTSGFIQEEEYERRRAALTAQKRGDLAALIQQPASADKFQFHQPHLPTIVPTPEIIPVAKPKPAPQPTPLAAVPAPSAPKYVNSVNPFVYSEDYFKITSPVVFVSKKGWTKERDNSGVPDEPTDAIRRQWEQLQTKYASQVQTTDNFEWTAALGKPNTLKLVGGLDISFPKGNKIDAVVCLAVCTYPDSKLVFTAYKMIKLKAPYVPGLLNFREVPYYEETLAEVKQTYPQFMPQVLILDGNGIIHPRACGVACQLGVLTGIPSFGVAKKLLVFDGLSQDNIDNAFKRDPSKKWVDMIGSSGKLHGRAFKYNSRCDPVYISAGHNISLETSQTISDVTAKGREPEAVNQSDLLGRDWLNANYQKL